MYHILICDDEKDIVSAIEIYLKAEGYKIFKAYTGKEALAIIRQEEIHLVLNGWAPCDDRTAETQQCTCYPTNCKK